MTEHNVKAFLDMLAISELTRALLAVSDNGYNVLVGSTATHPLLFNDYSKHPHVYNAKFNSTAAGRYQIIFPTWNSLQQKLGLRDFGKESQDIAATELIKEVHAYDDIMNGNIELAIQKCGKEWASLAGAGSGQRENSLEFLKTAYNESRGNVS